MSLSAGGDPGSVFTPRQLLAGQLSLGLAAVVTVAALYAISFSFNGRVSLPRPSDPTLSYIIDNPEPSERAQFLAGLVLVPALLLLFYATLRRWSARLVESRVPTLGRRADVACLVVCLGLLAAGLAMDRGFVWGSAMNQGRSWMTPVPVAVALITTLALCPALFRPDAHPAMKTWNRVATAVFGAFGACLILLVGAFGVIRLGDVAWRSDFFFSFNVMFFPVVQVYLGRELLVDLMSQYGLFPHLLEPLFRVVGLSVFSFSLLMGLLNVAAFLGVYRFLRAVLLNRLLTGLTMIAILFNCYFFGRSGSFDLFFQYYPVRFLFPALFIPLTWRYFARGERKVYHLAFLLAAVAVLWNTDTGLVVWLSWMLALLFHEAASRRFARIPGHLLLGLGTLAGTVLVFSLYLFLRYGHLPNYAEFLHYQRLYYVTGYGMLPMAAIHPWNMVLLVYAAGLLYAVMHLVEGEGRPKAASVFFLSVLGCGIFSYFQGRSHDGNLLMVAYPAIILAAIFADGLLARIRVAREAAPALLVALFVFTLAFSLAGMARALPAVVAEIHGRWNRGREPATTVTRAAEFVKANTRPGEEVLIISDLSSVYHLESRTLAPRGLENESGAGKGFKNLWDRVRRAPKVFLAMDWEMAQKRDMMLANYKPAARTEDGYLYLFLPNPQLR